MAYINSLPFCFLVLPASMPFNLLLDFLVKKFQIYLRHNILEFFHLQQNFSSDVRVRLAVLNNIKTILILKRLLEFMYSIGLTLLLTMALHLHHGRWCPIVCHPSGIVVTTIKYVFLQQYVVCCLIKQYLVVNQSYQFHSALWKGSTGFTLSLYPRQGNNLKVSVT